MFQASENCRCSTKQNGLDEENISKIWNETSIVGTAFKKGDPSCFQNYRSISLLSEQFTTIIANCKNRKLEEYQPVEQAAFRKGDSIEHIWAIMNELTDKLLKKRHENVTKPQIYSR